MTAKRSTVKSEARVAAIAKVDRDPVTGRLRKKTPATDSAPVPETVPDPVPDPAGGGAPAPAPFRGFRARLRQRSGS